MGNRAIQPEKTRSTRNRTGRLLLPAASERSVKLHQALVLVAACLGKCEFGGEEGTLAVQDFEIRRGATLVSKVGEPNRLLQIGNGLLLPHTNLVEFLIADQSIGDVCEGVLDGLLICDERLPRVRPLPTV